MSDPFAPTGKPNSSLRVFKNVLKTALVASFVVTLSFLILLLSTDNARGLISLLPCTAFIVVPFAIFPFLESAPILRERWLEQDLGGSLDRALELLDVAHVRLVRSDQGLTGAVREIMRQLPYLNLQQSAEIARTL